MNRISGEIGNVFALLFGLIAAVGLSAGSVSAQQTTPTTELPDDIIRVSTKLVQTNVTVVDKQGKFVDNLGRDDFEILIDDKLQPISLFDLVRASDPAAKALTAGRTTLTPSDAKTAGRFVVFFVDDLHLAPDSVLRVRKMIEHYVEQQMAPDDQVLIASPSGQIGFLQQFTDSKEALQAAVDRLKYRATTVRDNDRPPMSEFQALTIERGDEQLLTHYVSFLSREQFAGVRKTNQTLARELAEKTVHERARRILMQSDYIARVTLTTLESVTRSVVQTPGRKLLVMVSDGFLYSNQSSEVSDRVRNITDAALRAGAVIYSLQGSGLNTGFPDAASTDVVDENGDTGRPPLGEDFAMQAPLYQLAEETGGQALLNTNDLSGALKRALEQTAQYYLLAWRPDDELLRERKFHRIKVRLKAHPEFSARINGGFFSETSASSVARTRETTLPPQAQLSAAISSVFHTSSLRTSLALNYMETPAGPRLTILVRAPLDENGLADQKQAAADIVGVVLDDHGKSVGSFGDHLTATAQPGNGSSNGPGITYLNQMVVKPGLFQVRVAARDSGSGNIGRAIRWIEVPDVASGKLAMSSLLLGERDSVFTPVTDPTKLPPAQLKIDNHFNRKSRLRMLFYVYNAASAGGSKPQVDIQIQLWRQHTLLVSSQPKRLELAASEDLREVPFAEEVSLAPLATGSYVLRVTATDRVNRRSIARDAAFQVE